MRLRSALLVVLSLTLALPLRSDKAAYPRSSRMANLPRLTLWAWERRDDLSALDPSSAAVAQLVETVTLDGPIIRVLPQRNHIFLPTGAKRIAVVRVQTHQPSLSHDTAAAVASELARIAQYTFAPLPHRDAHSEGTQLVRSGPNGAVAFQVDFDALQSQRSWYRDVLTQLRAQMPPDMPLSITALASWCSGDRWIHTLPVDEAVPMLFRMEPGMRGDHDIPIREPLCAASAGISTREAWPRNLHGKRIYIFPDGGWQHDNISETLKALR